MKLSTRNEYVVHIVVSKKRCIYTCRGLILYLKNIENDFFNLTGIIHQLDQDLRYNFLSIYPREGPGGGVKSRMCPPYPQCDRKRRLNGAVCRNHRIKRVVPCRCLDGHVKEPYEMSMAWEPDRRSNFFGPPAHLLCRHIYD